MLKRTVKNQRVNDVGKFTMNGIKIGKSIRHVEITYCRLSSPVYKHIADQLRECDKLMKLNLSRTGNIPMKLGRAIASMRLLEVVSLSHCRMTPCVSRAILTGLSHCKYLKEIHLDDNRLTDCLGHIFTQCTEFPFLEDLNISESKITQSDFKNLLVSLSHRKMPKLQNFQCEDNYTLFTVSLALLLDVAHYPESKALFDELFIISWCKDPGFEIIVKRYLDNSHPSRGDVHAILAAACYVMLWPALTWRGQELAQHVQGQLLHTSIMQAAGSSHVMELLTDSI